jgi:Helicase conserved C-terminal domain
MFINAENGNTKNIELFKRRIIGLTSYFRSAQESLMPRYDKLTDFKVIRIPMSDYQFTVYEAARAQERKQEKSSKKKKGAMDENGIYKDPSSTYRIFSRLYCNFVMPKPPGRPLPKEEREETTQLEEIYEDALKAVSKKGGNDLEGDAWDGELEGDEAIEKLADATYDARIERALTYVKEHETTILSPEGLQTYSPKYLHILENIQDPEHRGLHLIYSQFRTIEGIGIFKMVLDANGFTQFKIKKDADGIWNLNIDEENRGKPTYALYTGTESAEEKEIIRNIYNSNWDVKSPITTELKEIAHNNHMGEIIKVLMITASGSEGINLRSTRYVHVMEPYWHPARIEQVIGRARRICSHKELPEELQTVEVYLYLMMFSQEQIKSDASIELKRKDLSKKKYTIREDKQDFIPFTSDQALYEISTIKEEVSSQLMTAIKEASIDCAIYTKRGTTEQLNCLQFGEPSPNEFSYIPNYKKEEPDSASKMNKKVIEWRGKPYEFRGKKYIYRKLDSIRGNLYDFDSYYRALENPQIDPILVATTEQTTEGVKIRKI